jgi:hypothetical protein
MSHVHVLLLNTIFFKHNHHFILEKTLLYMQNFNLMDSNIIKIQCYNIKTTKVIINAQE